jgi:hypothetical protein
MDDSRRDDTINDGTAAGRSEALLPAVGLRRRRAAGRYAPAGGFPPNGNRKNRISEISST